MRLGWRAGLVALALAATLGAQSSYLIPYPRNVFPAAGHLQLAGAVSIAARSGSREDRFAAALLAGELRQIEHVRARVEPGRGSAAARIVLVRSDTAAGRRLLAQAHLVLRPAARAEGYALIVNARQAAVVAASAAGIFYGVQTLRQWIHPDGRARGVAGEVRIVDWPALRWRGLQIDLSRGPIPTQKALERDLALLGELKVNAFVLYFENTFAYKNQPLWSAPGGAIDAVEARRIVSYARKYHITVIPEQEAFGHVHLGLQAETYQGLDELPYGGLLSPAAPGSLDFIGQMFAELNTVFPGPFFHIGADETVELGTGRSQAMKEKEGPGPLYLNYIKAIDLKLAPFHRQILFWGDIAQAHPELLHELPKNMIAVPWDYSPRASFVKLIQPFTAAGLQTWVAPGVSNWSRIFPDYNEAIPNIENFVRDGRRLGSTGILNTNWDDDGESMFNYAWYGYAFGAACGWENAPDYDRFQNAYDWALLRADGHEFNQQIQDLTQIHKLLETAIHADGADRLMWHRAFSPTGQALYARMAPSAPQVRLLAEDVIASVIEHRKLARRDSWLLTPVLFAARRFDFVGQKAIYAHLIAALYDAAAQQPQNRHLVYTNLGQINSINGLLQDMRDGVSSLRAQYRQLWLGENTPYFLDNILVRYDDELMYWQRQTRRFDRISAHYAATGTLPALVEGGQ